MNGTELYALYVEQWELQNTIVDLWEDLTPEDQMVWEEMAVKLEPKE